MKKISTVLSSLAAALALVIFVTGGATVLIITTVLKDPQLINESGIIRGSIQRISKLALCGEEYSQPMQRLNRLLLRQPEQDSKTNDKNVQFYFDIRQDLLQQWRQLSNGFLHLSSLPSNRTESKKIRRRLLSGSELCWNLANRMVLHAQLSSEARLDKIHWLIPLYIVSALLIFTLLLQIRRYVHRRLEWLAAHDPLTDLNNRRAFNDRIQEELQLYHRKKIPFTLILFDLDNFKSVNDRFGHDVGDTVLRRFAELLKTNTRKTDSICRIGGEEFAVILTGAEGKSAAVSADKIRVLTSELRFTGGCSVTVSGGIAEVAEGDSLTTLFKRADEALYFSKEHGRNKITAGTQI